MHRDDRRFSSRPLRLGVGETSPSFARANHQRERRLAPSEPATLQDPILVPDESVSQ
jgi:hypothetical protein